MYNEIFGKNQYTIKHNNGRVETKNIAQVEVMRTLALEHVMAFQREVAEYDVILEKIRNGK